MTVEFEEEQSLAATRYAASTQSGLSGWLTAHRFADNNEQAMRILLGVAVLCFLCALFFLFLSGSDDELSEKQIQDIVDLQPKR